MPACRKCNADLIVGSNWYKSSEARDNCICKACLTAMQKARADKWDTTKPAETKGEKSTRQRFSRLKNKVFKLNLNFDLDLSDYAALRSQPCYYCGDPLPEHGVGLDQRVPGGGYMRENVVPCCTECNIMKSNRYNVAEMLRIGPFVKSVRDQRNGAPAGSPLSAFPVTYEEIDRLFVYLHTSRPDQARELIHQIIRKP